MRSLHGIHVHGFPNLFIIGGLHQAAVSINQPLVFGDQAAHVSRIIKDALDRCALTVEVRPEAQQHWGEVIAARSTYNHEASHQCTPGAFNNENADEKTEPGVFATAYGGGPIEYANVLQAWRAEGMQHDLAFTFKADQPTLVPGTVGESDA